MYTSLLLAVVMGPGAAPHAVAPEAPTWQKDYVAARKKGRQENRALAVFIGSGSQGPEKVCVESKLTPAVRKLLADSYVCVFVDTSEARGKRLSEEFDLARGLVLSTRDGESQAFRQNGRISSADLELTLKRFANGYRNSRTETLQEIQQVSYGAPARPAAPAPIMQSFGGFSGSFGGFRGGSC
jgi:hypothetical protein